MEAKQRKKIEEKCLMCCAWINDVVLPGTKCSNYDYYIKYIDRGIIIIASVRMAFTE